MLAFGMVFLAPRTASAEEAPNGGGVYSAIDTEPVLDPDDGIQGGSSNLQLFAQGMNVQVHSQADIRAYIKASKGGPNDPTTFSSNPLTTAPYSPGTVSTASLSSALKLLNQIRYIAGIDYDVTLDASYTAQAQAASLVNFVNGSMSHYPARPAGMSDALYNLGYQGAGRSNIAWGYSSLGHSLMAGWMADDDSSNIAHLGHRRWVLNPTMGKTGFGLVGSEWPRHSAMYALDMSRSSSYFGVAWPAQNMPVEYFANSYPWSISMGQSVSYDTVSVTLTRLNDGRTWTFNKNTTSGYFNVNNDGYGAKGCIIFRPDSISYAAGDSFRVTISGLSSSVSYGVNFFSLIDPPVITVQPQHASYAQNASASSLTVSAQGEGLRYQWYSNTANSNTGGTRLSYQTSQQHRPSTATPGTMYYYVEVSNNGGSVVSQPARVTVTVPVTGVSLSKTSASVVVGGTLALTATVAPSNATNKAISWASSNTAVATVSASGKVTAVKAGTATITVTAKDGAKKATCAVRVVVPVTGVTLSAASKSLVAGTNFTLVATVAPATATNKAVTWASSNTAVATVGADGKVVAVKAGTVKITVTTKDGSKTAVCVVTVTPAIANGTYVIRTIDALSKTKALDIQGASAANGAKVQIWEFNNTSAQRFSFTRGTDGYYTIKSVSSSKVLDVAGGIAASGRVINQYASNGTDAQKWTIAKNGDGSYTISPKLNTKLCLDIQGGSAANGAVVQLYAKNNTAAQRFKLVAPAPALANGTYTVGASYANKVLDVSGASTANGANIQLWASNGTSAQKFKLSYNTATGYYTITNAGSNKVLDVSGAAGFNGANVQQWASNGTFAQCWMIEKVGSNYRVIAAHSGLVLDAAGAGTANGTNVQTWTSNGSAAQMWKFTKVG
jgi:uncharacterized protein YjdB